ncbi:S-CspCI protein [candidate division TA06 bacterium B3_TA06]|uniref:S-CspCI protein n=1 Tax=candidate division TA06 bacterium B3_TA06 TaxID=2012487 RepID=A0A532V9A7_UNCT6|nr:MAG: S-CspCI protein [candidate division TA06 bacterium B3_TA06]
MKLVRVSDLFDIKYGDSLELNRLEKDDCGINFVSRTAKNNGVSAKVKRIPGIEPTPANTITVALGGSVLETFLQPEPFYSGYHIFCLTPKVALSEAEKLFYCACIRANQYRYNYGRQANRTLAELLIPSREEIPTWVNKSNVQPFDGANQPFTKEQTPKIATGTWEWFKLQDLFEIKKGKRLTKANMKKGNVPFIGSIDSNNGYREYIGQKPIHTGNTITVNYNGSVAEAFYQPQPFWASDDVNVLYPKFEMNQYIALFIVSLIKLERYRFNYGRKWHMERMKESRIKLPVTSHGEPDYEFMGKYIKSLPYSSSI